MITIDLCNEKILLQRKTELADIKKCLEEQGFDTTSANQKIKYNGKCEIFGVLSVVLLCFDLKSETISSASFVIYPPQYDVMQKKLIECYGMPDLDNKWHFDDAEMEHKIVDRFGDTELIHFKFD